METLLEKLRIWAEAQSDLVGVALLGSHARRRARPDSDVDLLLLSEASQDRAEDHSWVLELGEVRAVGLEEYGVVRSVRAWYRHELEVEFVLASPEWARLPLDEGTCLVLRSGCRIVHDPSDLLLRAVQASAV